MAKKKTSGKDPTITADEVTANLRRLFPDKEICCEEIIETWVGTRWENQFVIKTNAMTVFVTGKMVWAKPTIRQWAAYNIYCKDGWPMYQKLRTKLGTLIPFVYLKKDSNKKYADLLLMACGRKAEPKAKNPAQRLKELGGMFYYQAYNMFASVKVVSASVIIDDDYFGRRPKQFCVVTTETGNYKFEIATGYAETENEIRSIFCDLLGIAATFKLKPKAA